MGISIPKTSGRPRLSCRTAEESPTAETGKDGDRKKTGKEARASLIEQSLETILRLLSRGSFHSPILDVKDRDSNLYSLLLLLQLSESLRECSLDLAPATRSQYSSGIFFPF